ncbi:MAG: pyridoxal-phosphate dependent enzyme [Leeuwenhoekiella sp.]
MSFFDQNITSPNEFIFRTAKGVELHLKREDQIDLVVSGNKFRKLKYNLTEAKKQGKRMLLTFGGAFSNHIAAVAKAGMMADFQTVGIIRGEELEKQRENKYSENPTLSFAAQCGMQLAFVDRQTYRNKHSIAFLQELTQKYGDCYIIPEGGTNSLAVKGCREILDETDSGFDIICCAAGTGGTAAGLIEASTANQKVLVFSALKGDFLKDQIAKYTVKTNWKLIADYHFGGYGKVSEVLVDYLNHFHRKHHIPLDPIYTGKMIYGLNEMISNGLFSENTRILAVHTGGLQGIAGMNSLLAKKKKNYQIGYGV